jgi:hypothetical protein
MQGLHNQEKNQEKEQQIAIVAVCPVLSLSKPSDVKKYEQTEMNSAHVSKQI